MSTTKQSLVRQLAALGEAGIPDERLYMDKTTGATVDRPGLAVLLCYAREGTPSSSTHWTGAAATRQRISPAAGSVRTMLLDDRGYVALLKLYLARTGYTSGPLFRASINGNGGPLSYDAAHHRWTNYCTAASVDIHQLRHAHATELINSGVSIEAVRRRRRDARR
nr:hypothetical protein [Amycolatopsis rhizosphaerae]